MTCLLVIRILFLFSLFRKSDLNALKTQLLNLVCASMIAEPTFGPEDQVSSYIRELVLQIAQRDPEFILKLSLYVRDDLNIRSTANFLCALAADTPQCQVFKALLGCRHFLLRAAVLTAVAVSQEILQGDNPPALGLAGRGRPLSDAPEPQPSGPRSAYGSPKGLHHRHRMIFFFFL